METTPANLELILHYFADFSPAQLRQLAALNELYTDWNGKINVISRKDIDSLYEKHVLHSLSIAAAFTFEKGMEVIDIGTGGGFPGIPLAIFFPEVQFHLVDSIGKELGDPVKAAAAVITAVSMRSPPLRLLLGSDAVKYTLDKMRAQRIQISACKTLSRSTDRQDGGDG